LNIFQCKVKMTSPNPSDEPPQASTTPKPILFFTALPSEGHTYPLLTVASSMIRRGYEVVFHGGPQFEPDVLAMGAEFSPIPSMSDPIPDAASVLAAGRAFPDQRLGLFVHGLVNFLFNTMPMRTDVLSAALADLRARDPARQIIVVHELCSMNVLPFAYGRPPPEGFTSFPKTIGIGAVNICYPSVDTAPFSLGLPFDPSPACILRNIELHKLADAGPWQPLFSAAERVMREAGCTTIPTTTTTTTLTDPTSPARGGHRHPFAAWYEAPNAVFQMCSPSMEYPLRNMPPKLRFAGCLPPRPTPPPGANSSSTAGLPDWWPDVLAAKSTGKKIIFVSQGTAHVDYTQLVIPTIAAFAERNDVLTVATLGIRGTKLEFPAPGPAASGYPPPNARIADFLPYDAILPHADVLVSNAGYGSTTHAAANGVPAVLSGEVLDKKEAAARAVWAGYAVDLGLVAGPSVEARIRTAVETVLRDPRFKRRAAELRAENEGMDCMAAIERQIVEFTTGGAAPEPHR
jgi:UDP:flavonoid glycosyltransferase YjiC (YdhE family)